MWGEVEGQDGCERCDDNGILGVFDSTPVTCHCEVGRNAKAANPDWLTSDEFDKKCKELGIQFNVG